MTSLRDGCNWATDLACPTNGPQDSESADTLMTHPDPVLAEPPWYSREEWIAQTHSGGHQKERSFSQKHLAGHR